MRSFIIFCLFTFFLEAKPLSVNVQAEAAVLMNLDTGNILFEKNMLAEHYPASLTKVATALYALKLKKTSLNENVQATQESLGTVTDEAMRKSNYTLPSWRLLPGTSQIGLKRGEILPFKDLFYGMLIASGGDAANVIAEYSAGSIPEFMKGLNEYIKAIGCTSSHFTNPHGLHHPDQKVCAYDMALIMKEAMKDAFFRKVINTSTYTRPKSNKQGPSTLIQTNKLLRPGQYSYKKTIGGKTGYLSIAQNTFVAAAKDNDRVLIAVLLKSKDRGDMFKDAVKLFESAFNQPKVERVFVKKGEQKPTYTDRNFSAAVAVNTNEDLALSFYPAEEPVVKGFIHWDKITPPLHAGQRVGEIRLVDNQSKVLKSVNLYSSKNVGPSLSYRIANLPWMWISLIVALIGGFYFFFIRR